ERSHRSDFAPGRELGFGMRRFNDEIKPIIDAVNEGIDAHLEACFCPDRGDHLYDGGKREAGKLVLCRTVECSVSPQGDCTLSYCPNRIRSLPPTLRNVADHQFVFSPSASPLPATVFLPGVAMLLGKPTH